MSRGRASSASRYSGKLSQLQSSPSDITTPGMSSTPSMTLIKVSWSSGRHGANPTPQFPITAVVTPWWDDGVIRSDQIAWPS